MHKTAPLLLAACLLLTACSLSEKPISIETSVTDFDMNSFDQPEAVNVTSNETIYNANDLVITTDSIESDSGDTYLILNFSNNSNQDISISCESASVNQFIMDTNFTIDLAAGNSLLAGIPFSNNLLNACGITEIAEIEFTLGVYSSEDFTSLFETPSLCVTTNFYNTSEQTVNTDGTVIYDKKDIQLISKGFAVDNEWGDVIVLLISNQSAHNIYVSLKDNSAVANDQTYEMNFGCNIPSGYCAIRYLYFNDEDGSHATEIDSASAAFTLTDTDTWKEIGSTPTINFSK